MSNKATFLITLIVIFIFIHKLSLGYDLTAVQNILTPREQKTISMDFKDALLADVLKIFSQQSGLNFIAASDISNKKINLYLDKVPVEEALERILIANGLQYELNPDSNIFLVKQLVQSDKELMTRVYPLKFATVSTSKINNAFSSETLTSDESKSNDFASDRSGFSSLVNSVKAVLSSAGTIQEDSRTNSLIITDIPSQFQMIEGVLSRLDIWIPQVLIEVEMLDISKGTADLLGAKYGDTMAELQGSSKLLMFPFNANNGFQTRDKVVLEDDGSGGNDFSDTPVTTRYNVGSISFTDLRLTLQFIKSQTDTKSLARPRILTLNNEPAEIKIETDEAIQVDSKNDPDSNTTTTTVTRQKTGVSLKVTPQANLLTNEITLSVQPTVTDTKTSNLISSGVQIKDPETRVSKSMLRIKNGDTVVIGGLLRTDSSDTRTSVPGISRVPLLGAAFRHKEKSEKQRELVIFITPHIINEHDSADFSTTVTSLDREQSFSGTGINSNQ